MNIEIANRLVELRKKNGYSQEELADKLGISRQAISKWETASASPDTDNLICLAKLYNISLDELLNTDMTVDEIAETKKMNEENVEVADEVKDDDEDDEDDENDDSEELYPKIKKINTITSIISGVSLFSVIIAYLLLGFLANGFRIYWFLFIFFPVIPSIYNAIAKKKFTNFIFPLFAAGLYCALGVFLGMDAWRIAWIVFLFIPIYYIIFNRVDALTREKRVELGLARKRRDD